MPNTRHAVSLVAAALICAGGSSARAEDPMAAAALFRRGSQLLNEGSLAEACAAFEQSLRLDPQLGTRFNVARCHEEQGRLASAWITYRELAQSDGNPVRRDEAARRAQGLEPRLTRLVVTSVDAATGLAVTRNGVDATASLGVEVPVDAGE